MNERILQSSHWSRFLLWMFCVSSLIFNSCKEDNELHKEVYSSYNAKGIQIYLYPSFQYADKEVKENDIYTQYFWINKDYIHWADYWDEDLKIEDTVNKNLPYYDFTVDEATQIFYEIFGIDMDKINNSSDLTTYQLSLWNYLMTHRTQYKYIAYNSGVFECIYLFNRTSSVNYD